MNLNEAREILKQNRFILEDNMHDRAMARVDRAYQHAKDLQFYDLDPLRSRHGSEAWEEGGHAEYDYTSKDDSDGDEKEEFGRKVAKKLVDYFKPIYEKRGYVPDEYGGGDDNWDWAIKDILDKFMYHAVGEDEKLSFMNVDEAVKYVIPTAYKVLEQCWDKKANWFDIYKFRYINIKESKEILKNNGYLLKENSNELTKQEKYALLYLLLKEQGVKLIANFKNSVNDDQEIDFVIDNKYTASIKNGQFGDMSDDLADNPDTIYYAVWFSDDEDDYKEETYDINEIIEYVKAGKWNQFVREELLRR